ncbi:hypothetical protein GGR88_002562 [Sphingomonas jejuensis]|uniref:Uncharacterized protein n=1 Tax=Sphingomonas jejuensis TaxID=904715 RepID=A0ABX0XPB2_9SPHN|nr:hypothetical protein [Sphingomonas jejuensis]NJC35048.1 hypothetical protein [Sphingomonas jejuensis]
MTIFVEEAFASQLQALASSCQLNLSFDDDAGFGRVAFSGVKEDVMILAVGRPEGCRAHYA